MDELRERQTHTANHLLKLNTYRLGSNKLCEAQPRRGGRGAPANSSHQNYDLNIFSYLSRPSMNFTAGFNLQPVRIDQLNEKK